MFFHSKLNLHWVASLMDGRLADRPPPPPPSTPPSGPSSPPPPPPPPTGDEPIPCNAGGTDCSDYPTFTSCSQFTCAPIYLFFKNKPEIGPLSVHERHPRGILTVMRCALAGSMHERIEVRTILMFLSVRTSSHAYVTMRVNLQLRSDANDLRFGPSRGRHSMWGRWGLLFRNVQRGAGNMPRNRIRIWNLWCVPRRADCRCVMQRLQRVHCERHVQACDDRRRRRNGRMHGRFCGGGALQRLRLYMHW